MLNLLGRQQMSKDQNIFVGIIQTLAIPTDHQFLILPYHLRAVLVETLRYAHEQKSLSREESFLRLCYLESGPINMLD